MSTPTEDDFNWLAAHEGDEPDRFIVEAARYLWVAETVVPELKFETSSRSDSGVTLRATCSLPNGTVGSEETVIDGKLIAESRRGPLVQLVGEVSLQLIEKLYAKQEALRAGGWRPIEATE